MDTILFKTECYKIVGCCMEVHKFLGSGLLEAVYHEAFAVELQFSKIIFAEEVELPIEYKGVKLEKKYRADFVCYDEIIVELKAVKELDDIHSAQLINYLKITDKKVGLLINFGGQSLEFKRFINQF